MALPLEIASGHRSKLFIRTKDEATPASIAAIIGDDGINLSRMGARALFADEADFLEIGNIREMPTFGTPPNIVNVPVFGQDTSQQIQAQSDTPTMEFTVSYVASDWAPGGSLAKFLRNGKTHWIRWTLITGTAGDAKWTTTEGGLGGMTTGTNPYPGTPNFSMYYPGKIEALQITPSTSDSVMATITMSIPSGIYYGPYTVDIEGTTYT